MAHNNTSDIAVMSATILTMLGGNTLSIYAGNDNCLSVQGIEHFSYAKLNLDTTSPKSTYVFPRERNYREKYKKMVQSEWYKSTYHNKSVGDLMRIED